MCRPCCIATGATPGNAVVPPRGSIDDHVAGREHLGVPGHGEVGLDDDAACPVGFAAGCGGEYDPRVARPSTPAAQTTERDSIV